MKILFPVVVLLAHFGLQAQFRSQPAPQYFFNSAILSTPQKTFIQGVLSDPIQNYRPTSPILTNYPTGDWHAQNISFWTGTVTTMSFNKGKFGTLYYWDLQGNLRGSRGFIDISGKNKRGFKLVFPWRKF